MKNREIGMTDQAKQFARLTVRLVSAANSAAREGDIDSNVQLQKAAMENVGSLLHMGVTCAWECVPVGRCYVCRWLEIADQRVYTYWLEEKPEAGSMEAT